MSACWYGAVRRELRAGDRIPAVSQGSEDFFARSASMSIAVAERGGESKNGRAGVTVIGRLT